MRIKGMIIITMLLFFVYFTLSSEVKKLNSGNKEITTSNTSKTGKTIQANFVSSDSKLNRKKLKAEISELQEEVKELRSSEKKIRNWITALGGILAAIGGALLGIFGVLINRTLNRTQTEKMIQDKEFGREKHLLDIFHALGDDKPRIRLAAVAILLQRLKKIHIEKTTNEENIHEYPTIVNVLIAESKHEDNEELQKYIADGIADVLEAIVPKEYKEPARKVSPMRDYKLDFQKSHLNNAWWRRIDAREVDFFEASLVKASLREAFLQKAIFYNAVLNNVVLKDANLEGANLEKAKLIEANLSRANLKGAILKDVNLTSAIIDDADFIKAEFNSGTNIRREQLGKAKFDEDVEHKVTIVD